jgi:hypothetical protein
MIRVGFFLKEAKTKLSELLDKGKKPAKPSPITITRSMASPGCHCLVPAQPDHDPRGRCGALVEEIKRTRVGPRQSLPDRVTTTSGV